MKQLALIFDKKERSRIPDFDTWYYENTKERLLWKEKPYSRKKGKEIYLALVKNNFWGV
tara:strand:- start:263 stop:439 length:177 start_codon:yes stop_codon:yes gene_type:complete